MNSFVVHGVGHDSGANAGGGVSIAHSVADGGTGCGALRVTTSSTDSASASSGGDRAAITANSVNACTNNAGGSSDNDNIDDDDDDLVNDHVIISHVTYLITISKYLAYLCSNVESFKVGSVIRWFHVYIF